MPGVPAGAPPELGLIRESAGEGGGEGPRRSFEGGRVHVTLAGEGSPEMRECILAFQYRPGGSSREPGER